VAPRQRWPLDIDTLVQVENLTRARTNDTLAGDQLRQRARQRRGPGLLWTVRPATTSCAAAATNDRIVGGIGADQLYGGYGDDDLRAGTRRRPLGGSATTASTARPARTGSPRGRARPLLTGETVSCEFTS
jgi:hypothetical protein